MSVSWPSTAVVLLLNSPPAAAQESTHTEKNWNLPHLVRVDVVDCVVRVERHARVQRDDYVNNVAHQRSTDGAEESFPVVRNHVVGGRYLDGEENPPDGAAEGGADPNGARTLENREEDGLVLPHARKRVLRETSEPDELGGLACVELDVVALCL